jgi:uncharacterized membrane protein YkvA (DUF1232 family)
LRQRLLHKTWLIADLKIRMWKLLLILAAVLYSLSPIDILPDYHIPFLGYLDDIAVWFVLWKVFTRMKQRMEAFENRTRSGAYQKEDTKEGHHTVPPRSPHEILGVSPGATMDEIKHAYRQLAAQYHPDKVTHLGEEFRTLAEKRFKEIQEAHQELIRKKKE